MLRSNQGCFLLATILLLAAGCHRSPERSVVARVNGDPVSVEEFRQRLDEYRAGAEAPLGPSAEAEELKDHVLREMIEETALVAEARKRNLDVSDAELEQAVQAVTRDYPPGGFDELLRQQKISRSRWRQRTRTKLLLDKVIAEVAKGGQRPRPEEVESYYKGRPEEFFQQEQVHLQQIVVKTKEDAEKILEELKKGVSFSDLAKAHSFTPEAAQGGDLGFIIPGGMPKPLEDAIVNLPLKKPTGVIESDYGFHIVQVLERRPARQLSLSEATPVIVDILTQKEREERFEAWRQEVLSRAKIERNHALLANIH